EVGQGIFLGEFRIAPDGPMLLDVAWHRVVAILFHRARVDLHLARGRAESGLLVLLPLWVASDNRMLREGGEAAGLHERVEVGRDFLQTPFEPLALGLRLPVLLLAHPDAQLTPEVVLIL